MSVFERNRGQNGSKVYTTVVEVGFAGAGGAEACSVGLPGAPWGRLHICGESLPPVWWA